MADGGDDARPVADDNADKPVARAVAQRGLWPMIGLMGLWLGALRDPWPVLPMKTRAFDPSPKVRGLWPMTALRGLWPGGGGAASPLTDDGAEGPVAHHSSRAQPAGAARSGLYHH